jgi:hypothetical protein
MPIKSSQPPSQALDALNAGVNQFRQTPGAKTLEARPVILARNAVQESVEGMPHQVFQLSLDDVSAGKGVNQASASGWRFLVGKGSDQAVAGEVHSLTGNHEFGGLSHGANVAKMVELLQQAERLPEVQNGDFEPRLLRVPALYIVAIWLKDRKSGQDILIPLPPSGPPLVVGQHYSASDFEAVLKAAADARIAAPPAPGHPSPSAP